MGIKHIHLNHQTHNGVQEIPPFRFNCVEYGLYRSGYPKPGNYAFLSRLQLKTILSLTPLVPEDVRKFADKHGIKHIHLPVAKAKDHVPWTQADLTIALNVIINDTNQPILVHCLDGANVTGVLIMSLRNLQLWEPRVGQTEFSRYTREGVISQDELDFVEKYGSENTACHYQVSITNPHHLKSLNADDTDFTVDILSESIGQEIEIPETIPKWLWTGTLPLFFLKSVHSIGGAPIQPSNPSSAVSTPLSPIPASHSNLQITYAHPSMRIRLFACHIKSLLARSQWLSKLTPLEAAKLLLTKTYRETPPESDEPRSALMSPMLDKEGEVFSGEDEEEEEELSLTVQALHLEGV